MGWLWELAAVSAVAQAFDKGLQASLGLFVCCGQLRERCVGLDQHSHALLEQFRDAIESTVNLVRPALRVIHSTLGIGLAL